MVRQRSKLLQMLQECMQLLLASFLVRNPFYLVIFKVSFQLRGAIFRRGLMKILY
jgi:hypothetical protein